MLANASASEIEAFRACGNSELAGEKANHNTERTAHLIRYMKKTIDFGTRLKLFLGPWAILVPPWDLKDSSMHCMLHF